VESTVLQKNGGLRIDEWQKGPAESPLGSSETGAYGFTWSTGILPVELGKIGILPMIHGLEARRYVCAKRTQFRPWHRLLTRRKAVLRT
jgi:hypothetical protein